MMNSEIKKAIEYLKAGKTILCPTDTLWGISCDATNFDAVENIYKIKNRDKSKSLIVLVNSFEMLKDYISNIPENLEDIFKQIQKPLSVIYDHPKNLAKNTLAENGSVAIRIVKDGFCHELITRYAKPIVSSSANFSNKKTALSFSEIDKEFVVKVDFVVDKKFASSMFSSSTIIKIVDEEIIIIRN